MAERLTPEQFFELHGITPDDVVIPCLDNARDFIKTICIQTKGKVKRVFEKKKAQEKPPVVVCCASTEKSVQENAK